MVGSIEIGFDYIDRRIRLGGFHNVMHPVRADARCASGPRAGLFRPAPVLQIWQEVREQAHQRQECADLVNRFDAVMVGHPTEHGRADAGHAEGEAEKHAGDQADAAGKQLLRVDDDGRERRGEDQADRDRQHGRPEQVHVRQNERERKHAQDRDPDHRLEAEPIADGAAAKSSGRDGARKMNR